MRKLDLHIIIYIGAVIFAMAMAGCGKGDEKKAEGTDLEEQYKLPDTQTILSNLKQSADLVTTEVTIRKVCIYDNDSKKIKFNPRDTNTWKYGKRICIVPIQVTIKYGYDLREMSVDNIKLTDDSTAVVIELPEPKVVDSGYNIEINEDSVVCISTGFRDRVSHETIEIIRKKGFEDVKKEDISKLVGKDVEKNAKSVFESIVKRLGYKDVAIVIITKDKKNEKEK